MSADLLARLIEAGTPAALVGEVAMAIAAAQAAADAQIAAAVQPTKGALRMRAYRERHGTSQDVTCDAGDAQVTESVTQPAPAPSPLPSPCTPNQPHAPTPTRGDIPARTRGGVAWPCPADVDPAHWADLLANRKRKRQANTATAYQRLLRDLAKFTDDDWPPGRIVQHAAERGWAAIFDPRQSETRNGHRPDYHDRPSGWAPRPGAEGFEPASLDD